MRYTDLTKVFISSVLVFGIISYGGFDSFSTSVFANTIKPQIKLINGVEWVEISSAAQLEYIDKNQDQYMDSNIKIMNNINLPSKYMWIPFGKGYDENYNGTFNGQNYKISGITIGSTINGVSVSGFFGYTYGYIENLNLSVNLPEKVNGDFNASGGGLVGYQFGGSIINCHVTGNITSVAGCNGGLVGEQTDQSSIYDSSFNGTVSGGPGSINGGLVGKQLGKSIVIDESYASGSIINIEKNNPMNSLILRLMGDQYTLPNNQPNPNSEFDVVYENGGLVGSLSGTIKNSYAIEKFISFEAINGGINADVSVGGGVIINSYAYSTFLGSNSTNGEIVGINNYQDGGTSEKITNSFWGPSQYTNIGLNIKGSSYIPFENGESLNTMQNQSTYSGWDFNKIWGDSPNINSGLPYLLWKNIDYPKNNPTTSAWLVEFKGNYLVWSKLPNVEYYEVTIRTEKAPDPKTYNFKINGLEFNLTKYKYLSINDRFYSVTVDATFYPPKNTKISKGKLLIYAGGEGTDDKPYKVINGKVVRVKWSDIPGMTSTPNTTQPITPPNLSA
jgi:hypothetical protein